MDQEQTSKNAEHPENMKSGVDSHLEPTSKVPMDFSTWAARPVPRRRASLNRDGVDLDALKIFLILAGLTAGMALAIRSLF